jgi:phage baseplate assembly protein gpV
MSDENFILGVIERWWAGRYSERHGIVTSYDPKNYLAKVTLQPEGQETGWLPIETGHVGEGYGIVIGLQPGQGGVNAQGQGGQAGPQQNNQGDQVIIRFQEGDVESGKIVQRVHSDQDSPPQAQSGEMIFWTKFQKSGGQTPDAASGGQGGNGQQIHFKNDGSITVTDGNGATLVMDGAGNMTLNCKNFTLNASGSRSINVGGGDTVSIGGDKSVSIGGKRGDVVGGLWNALAKFGVWPWLQDDDG